MLRLSRTPKTSALRLTFAIPAESAPGKVSVVGNFNNWTPGVNRLVRRSNGTMSVSIPVTPGDELHFRYLGEDGHWFDEPDADRIDHQGSTFVIPE